MLCSINLFDIPHMLVQTHTHHLQDAVTPRNILDSSAPVQRRGKERETVKKKKPSNMRKVSLWQVVPPSYACLLLEGLRTMVGSNTGTV